MTSKFPSGRSFSRAKQDAKTLARRDGIPLHQALDIIAESNGSKVPWSEAMRIAGQTSPAEQRPANPGRYHYLAMELGITETELDQLDWDIEAITSDDGLIYSHIVHFDENSPSRILAKISGLNNLSAEVSAGALNNPHDPDEEEFAAMSNDMNPHRKLLILAVNQLVSLKLLPLIWDGQSNEDTTHVHTLVAGYPTLIAWSGISFGEVRISVWWKYEHDKHPQANLTPPYKEAFRASLPLAKRSRFKEFVGATCSGWLERKEGIYLQGFGDRGIFDVYTRRSEAASLKILANPRPLGFLAEGKIR